MDNRFLVATQISSLFSSHCSSTIIPTTRRSAPISPSFTDSDQATLEHATYASISYTEMSGTVLLRVLHGGLIVELVSLSSPILPIRFVFPSKLLPSPALFMWGDSEIDLIAVTVQGSLFRIVIPIGQQGELWHHQNDNIRTLEYTINSVPEPLSGLAYACGTHCVVLALPQGTLLRLELEDLGPGSNGDEWTESLFQQSSFLSSLTAFLPLSGALPGASDIISFASLGWPTDVGSVWSLSRDRTLRLWKAKLGCVSSKTLPITTDPLPPSSALGAKGANLLAPDPQTLLRVFSMPDTSGTYALVFSPSVSSPASGGTFHLFNTMEDQLYDAGTIPCTQHTAFSHLQDFTITNGTLFTLWDQQGRSVVRKLVLRPPNLGHDSLEWHTYAYMDEPELTPSYLEEQLLSPGSLADKFFEAVMRPGFFSALTLRTAIDQYTDACLTLPGPPPSQLTSAYASTGENIAAVVGCTVKLNRDNKTGSLQYENYWNALKRDWEGFIARCREIERAARSPLALGVPNPDDIVVVERERIGAVVMEDIPITVRKHVQNDKSLESLDAQYPLINVIWTLRANLGADFLSKLEQRLIDILHQEIAFSFADIIQDQARRYKFSETIDDGLASWIFGRLQSLDDLDACTRSTLDIIGGVDAEVKREEEEESTLSTPLKSEWSRSINSAYLTATVNARYDLCLSLILLLFFLSEQLSDWDPSLLAEVFVVFRGVAMLRFVSRQPGGNSVESSSNTVPSPDDVIARLRDMNMSRGSKLAFTPTYSLNHRLLADFGDAGSLPQAAHRFLDYTGLLQSISPADATKHEVFFCERLRVLGFHEIARELLSWLPRSPAVTYILAKLWLGTSRSDDAAYLLEKVAGSFGPESALSINDHDALAQFLPPAHYDTEFSFYVHASALFKSSGLTHHEINFAQLALSVAPEVDVSSLWHTVIKGLIDLGRYEESYASLMATPYEQQKRECVSSLVYRMCEDNAIDTLMTFNFAGLAIEVEDALAFKARNVDPRARPFYSMILYTWFINRGDFKNAALTMCQRARRLQDIVVNASSFLLLAEDILQSLLIAINALSLVEPKNAWIVVPVSAEGASEHWKRLKITNHIPDSELSLGRFDVQIVHLEDMRNDFALLSAQFEMIRRDPALLSAREFLLSPSSIVLRLAQANRFTLAMATARSLKVDMSDLFTHLTSQCMRLSRNPDSVIQEDTSDWLLTDKVSSWPGSPADKGWRFLRQSLERHDSAETDFRYSKATLEAILGSHRASAPPPWLITTLEKYHHEYLIRTCLRYELIDRAIEYTLSLIQKSNAGLSPDNSNNAHTTWLPYTLIDQVLVAATSQDFPPSHLAELRSELSSRVKRVQKLSQFPH